MNTLDNAKGIQWSDIKSLVLKNKKQVIAAHLIAFIAALVSVPIPLMMPLLVDEVLLDKPATAVSLMNQIMPSQWQGAAGYILTILGLVILMRVTAMILNVWQSRQFTYIGKHISFYVRQRLLNYLPKVQLREYETAGASGISSRCVTDVETLDTFISETLSKFLLSLLTIIGTAVVLLWLDWLLGLIILLLNPAVIYFSHRFGKRVKNLKKKENAAFEAFQSALIETLDAIQELRAARRENKYFSQVIGAANDLKNHAIQSNWKSQAVNRISFTIFLVGFEIFRAIAMLMVVFSDLTVGQIFAVFGYLWFMMGPVQELLSIQYSYYAASGALQRLNGIFSMETEPQWPSKVNPFSEQQGVGVCFDKVSFAYQDDRPVLENVSLDIPAGNKVAVVSVSGGGKSTLVQLLLGMYQKQAGEIRVNDALIQDVGYDLIRGNIATVLQQPMLFNASVRENLTMGGDGIEDEALWEALSVAELNETVMDMPDKLDTLIGNKGVRLSGGQKQRLAIARMVLSDPKMVILDESTSALDTETEARLHQNLERFLQQRTTLVIAHRLSAIRNADLIYVLEDGKITQTGKHKELVQQQGLYQTLYGHTAEVG